MAVGMAAVAQPLSYADLDAWSRYTGSRPSYIERRAIDIFDRIYLQSANSKG